MAEWTPENVRKSLTDLVKRLNNFKTRYLIIGAIPVQYYGRPRTSWDVDIAIMTPTTSEKLLKIFNPERYKQISREDTVQKFKDLETNSFIDVLLKPTELGLTSESFKRKRKITIEQVSVNIPSPEDYIITKLVARRPGTQDYSDIITTLERMYDKLDWKYLEKRTKTLNTLSLLKYYREGIKWKLKKK